ncbi:hypothetical protein GMDG_01517 [Pseudogymnoascus destructans 20631-21]|uniref:SNF2 N-terminal domain-containing protein n=1 Tax=Pseudogymnoascus destructans (strain ATCC MYA-4855 / 20631-21) TaxID=658429 RepID=L8FW23_PSED2|nr:hypothetical protein GMDG_01517 [Pseudogymnoascus destructans 20631-21]
MAGTPPSKRAKTQGGKQEAEAKDQDVPIPSGSSVTQVETPSRKRASASQTQVKKWAPGNPTLNDLSRLAEASVAGYLGYTDTLHLRDLMWSWQIMRGAMVFETILKNKLQVTATSILEASLNNVDAYEYETNIDTLVFNFNNRSEEDKANTEDTTRALTLMFAGTIHHTARALEDVGLLTLEDTELQSQFAKLRIEQSGVKGFFVPAFDKTTLLVPTLGPLDTFCEHAMECYSRAYTCVRYLLYQTTSSTPIKAKLGKNQYFVSGIVHPDRLPSWMGNETVEEVPGASAILGLMNQEKPAPIEVTLQFVREDGTEDDEQLSEHINSYLKRKKIHLSQDIVDYKHDIRDFEIGPQWRDHLRHELSLPRLRCDFSTLTLIPTALPAAEDPGPVHVPQEGPWIIYDNENPDQVTPWTDGLEVLHSGSKFCIEYSLKVVDTEEDGPYPYEFDGGPIQVYSDEVGALATTENTAAQDDATTHANHPTPCTHIAPAPAQVDIKGKGKGPETPELSHTSSKLSYLQDKLFGDCKSAESQAWHLGIDVSTPAGIEAFIQKVVGTLRVANVAPKAALNLSVLPGAVRQEIQSGMAAATATTLNADLRENEEDATSMAGFYKMQKLFTGDKSQTGPPLDACLTIADAHFDTWHDKQRTLAKYALKSLPTVGIRPLGHQITGFLWMVLKAYGYILAPTKEGQAAADLLQTAHTFGGVLVDNMGLGNYRPHLILAPAGPVIEQWHQDITKHFKGINLVLAYGDSPPNGASFLKWISSKAMKSYPKSPKKFPAALRFVSTNKSAAKTVILTSYGTLAGRTLQKPRRQPGDEKTFKPADWIGKWKGVFHTVILDEGHKIRNPLTNIHVAVARLNARHHWFITGTPVQNQSTDNLGPLNILWPQINKSLYLNQTRRDWIQTLDGNYKNFELLVSQDFPHSSWKNLIAADPYRIRTLLNSKEKSTINKLYSQGERLSLANLMPPYEITTVQLKMSSAEAAEYQFFHQSFVKDYEEGLEIWANQKQSRINPTAEVKSFPCITGPLRAMTVNAVSTILSRFHDTLDNTKVRKKRLDDTVATINVLRAQGFTGLQLAHATMRKGDQVIKDAANLIHHLTFGSLKMRWILKDVMDHCVKRRPDGGRNKLLCSEDIPVSAWFIETVLKSIYIRAEVLHAGLNDLQRIALIQEFNDPQSDLVVLVMMYQVSSQGANLDGACHRVCSVTTAINLPSELQVHYRPIRVSQKEKVTIVRLSVVNSHDAWRKTKQVDKSIIDVLTKLRSPESFQVIADALNDNRDEVLAAQFR